MIRKLLTCLLLLACYAAGAQVAAPSKTGTTVKANTLVFKLKPQYKPLIRSHSVESARLQETLQAIGATGLKQKFPNAAPPDPEQPEAVDLSLLFELQHKPGISTEKARHALNATGMLEYVEPLYIREPLYQPNDPLADSVAGTQYHLKNINAYKAWDIEKGDTSIVVGVIDTGFGLTHEDLAGQEKINYADPIDGIDNDNDGYIDNYRGWDVADNDNNTFYDVSGYWHGALVAGASSARTDNSKGGAGIGFRSKYLPIKAYPTTFWGSFAGFEGIVYAADQGCQVINLSWGGAGYPSRFEQDVINYAAINKNAVVIAAAGNTNADLTFYPAAYDNVLSVAALEPDNLKGITNTYNYTVDISAPGKQIMTTWVINDSTYTPVGGSSFAAPLVSGAAALVRARFPALSGVQVAERLRMTANNIDSLPGNLPYQEKLGRGILDVYKALTAPNLKSVRNTRNTVDKGYLIYPGDTISITGEFRNYLDPTSALNITLTSTSPYVTILQNQFAAGTMGTLTSKTNNAQPFKLVLAPNTPANTVIFLRYGFADGSYTDYQWFRLLANPDFVDININQLHVTVTSRGNIGYNGYNYNQGFGVRYKNSESLLAEGGLMIGADTSRVSSVVRGSLNSSKTAYELDKDFYTNQPIRFLPAPTWADMAAQGVLQDSFPSAKTVGVQVTQKAYAWQNAADSKYVVLEYNIKNVSGDTLKNLKTGLFADWDIQDHTRNRAGWDSAQALGYAYYTGSQGMYAGIRVLSSHTPPAYYALENEQASSATINITDGFSRREKYETMAGGVHRKTAGSGASGNDISHVVAASLPALAPGGSTTVAFAIIGGDNLSDLKASAAAAKMRYRTLKAGPVPLAQNDTICAGASALLTPAGATHYAFYADSLGHAKLSSGTTFNTGPLRTSTAYYITNADSTEESLPVAVQVVISEPKSQFQVSPDTISLQSGGLANFTDQSTGAVQWKWYFGDGDSSSVQHPVHTYKATGTYDVQLIITDKFSCQDTLVQQVVVRQVTGISKALEQALQVYPNPVQQQLQLRIPDALLPAAGMPYELFNSIGAKVLSGRTHATELQLNMQPYSQGIYLLKLYTSQGIITRKIEKSR